MSNDLSPQWIEENLSKARADLKRIESAYNSLKNQDTQYAKGIKRIMEAKHKVVEVWLNA